MNFILWFPPSFYRCVPIIFGAELRVLTFLSIDGIVYVWTVSTAGFVAFNGAVVYQDWEGSNLLSLKVVWCIDVCLEEMSEPRNLSQDSWCPDRG